MTAKVGKYQAISRGGKKGTNMFVPACMLAKAMNQDYQALGLPGRGPFTGEECLSVPVWYLEFGFLHALKIESLFK